jgi:2-keto-4-pentenoate hydratase/2-oxohepta-3-ene-1,7-dioic acid hydratase in catechol pathway
VAKGQDYFCPISGIIPKAKIPNPDDVGLWLKVHTHEWIVLLLLFHQSTLRGGRHVAFWYNRFRSIIYITQPVTAPVQVNGETRQQSSTKHMIRKTANLISYISHLFTLEPGDVILTGEAVSPCRLLPVIYLPINTPLTDLHLPLIKRSIDRSSLHRNQKIGTPEGVGPIKPGDKVTAGLDGIITVSFDVKAAD